MAAHEIRSKKSEVGVFVSGLQHLSAIEIVLSDQIILSAVLSTFAVSWILVAIPCISAVVLRISPAVLSNLTA